MAFCKTDPAQRRKIIGIAKNYLKIPWFISEKTYSKSCIFGVLKKTTKSSKYNKYIKFTIGFYVVKFPDFHEFQRFSSFFRNASKYLTSNMFFSEMNQRIFKFFFANPILFRRCAGSVLQNAMKKIAHNQTRDPRPSSDISRLVLEGGLDQY